MPAALHARSWAGPDSGAPTLVLVHGLVVSSCYLVRFARRLADDCHVLAPDLPGFGRTPGPPRPLDVLGLADALGDWLRSVAPPRPCLLGHSFGCQVAAELCARRPETVERLVLVAPTGDPQARSLSRYALRWLPEAARDATMLPLIVAGLAACGPRRAAATARAMVAHRLDETLPRVAVPTLVVGGDRDPVAPPRWTRAAASLLPDGRLELLRGRHALNWHAPAALAAAVLPFVLEGS